MKTKFLVRLSLLVLALGLGAALVPLARVQAATNVPCDTTALVNAIQDAVNAGGSQTLKLAKDCNYVLTAAAFGGGTADATGLPKINKVKLTIKGNGATIKRKANAPAFRLMFIAKHGEVTLNNLTLRGGKTFANKDGSGLGGAIYLLQGTLTLKQVTITNNETGKPSDSKAFASAAGYGGGIANFKGELTVLNSQITNNIVGDSGNSTGQSGGRGEGGGGIYSYYGMLTIDASTIDGNRAGKGGNGVGGAGGGHGGGIYATHLRLTNSTVSNNQAGKGGNGTTLCAGPGGSGGGIYAVVAVIANTTISGNQAGDGGTDNKTSGLICGGGNYPYASGGGLFASLLLVDNAAAGDIYITNSTITGNRAGHKTISPKPEDVDGRGGNLYVYGSFGFGYEVNFRNTIIGASGFGDPCTIADLPANLPTVIVNVANNLDSGTSCGFGSANGSKSNANAQLGALQDNGGDTFTHALLPGSQALDAGSDIVCAAAVGAPNYGAGGKDQREITRPQFAHCDIGAYEHQAPPTATPTPTSTPTVTPSPTPTQVPPGGDGALDFDGTDDFVEIGTSANLLLNADLTLEIWAKPDSFSNNPTLITRAVEGDGDAANNYSYYFYITPAKNLALFWEWGTGFTEITLTSSVAASINAGEWHHLAVTRSATNSTVRFFVDGVELGTAQSFGTLPTGGSNGRTVIGANPRPTDTTLHFDGQLDEARIWKIVRTPSEIQANLHKQLNVASSGLVAYYKFDETTGQTINDASTPAENGTLGKTGSVASDDPTRVTLTAPGSSCAGPSNGRVSCWKGEDNANDSVGTNNGTLEGSVTFVSGKVGQAFSFDGTTADVRVPASSSLNVGSANGLTIAAWVNPTTLAQRSPLVEWNNNGTFGAHFWMSTTDVLPGGVNGNLYANLLDTGGWDHKFQTTGVVLAANSWNHVVLTYDKTNGNVAMYVNGVASSVSTSNLGIFTPQTTYAMYIARRVAGQAIAARLSGKMDEVQIWNRALTAQEIQDVYNDVGGSPCTDKPSKPTLKVPADGTIINTNQPKLKWNAAECATTYNVTIQDSLGQTVAKETGLTKPHYTPLLTPGYTYKWFVHAVNEHGKTKSVPWTFFIE